MKPEIRELELYRKTRPLLSIYRTVVWRIEGSICETEETAGECGVRRIAELVDFLNVELDDYGEDKKALEDRLISIAETKLIIDIIDNALAHLKTHPDRGEIFHDIIAHCFINREKMSDAEIWKKMHLTQSTFYRYKKQAIQEMGVVLRGLMIPALKDYWDA